MQIESPVFPNKNIHLTPYWPSGDPHLFQWKHCYRCRSCRNILRNAYQLPCGDHLCEDCVKKTFTDSESAKCPEVSCGEPFHINKVMPDIGLRKEIANVTVYCPNKPQGCKETLPWKKLQEHLPHCYYEKIPCSNRGCKDSIIRRRIETHEKKKCNFRLSKSPDQSKSVQEDDDPVHLKSTSPKLPTKCKDNTDGTTPKQQSSTTEADCQQDSSSGAHDALIVNIQKIESETRKQLVHTKSEVILQLESVTEEIEAERQDIGQIKQDTTLHEQSISSIKVLALKEEERLGKIESRQKECVSKNESNTMTKKLAEINEWIKRLEFKIQKLEQRSTFNDRGNQNGPDSIQYFQQKTALLENRFTELFQRLETFQGSVHDGCMLWKINDYGRRKREAVTGRTTSLFSPPFYVGKHGYKLCGRVYLNGDGIGRGTHLSCYIIVMKGEYDALLTWPFQNRVSMIILTQDGTGKRICDSFAPDTRSNSFQRPVHEMNVGSGIPKFIAQTELETPMFLQDDTLYLMIKVENGEYRSQKF